MNENQDVTDFPRLCSNDYQHMDDGQSSTTTDSLPQTQRVIYFNAPDLNVFCTNKVSTAKYNFLTFLPKFLFEQFRKYANIFFLFISLLQQIPNVSPTGRYTTAFPLLFILMVSAIKEIIEDFKRHRADDGINNRKVQVHRNDQWVQIKWTDIVVGDIVKVMANGFFPADLVLLSSSEPQAMCYVQTSNLDGETNLKLRQGHRIAINVLTGEDLCALRGLVRCEEPSRHLYEFVGNVQLQGNSMVAPLGSNQLLLRGAMLRNTGWIFGLVVYTGHQTKLVLNSTSTPLKRSNVERVTNKQILFLFFGLMVLSLISAIGSVVWNGRHKNDWYLYNNMLMLIQFLFRLRVVPYVENPMCMMGVFFILHGVGIHFDWASHCRLLVLCAVDVEVNFGMMLLTFITLYNNLIPISLQVTLELVKFIQAIFINWDLDMYCEATDTPAMARTSNLNEELGQVQYIFSDKTGTLTQNVMEFRKCSIAGICYGSRDNEGSSDCFNDPSLLDNIHSHHETAGTIHEFLVVLAVCHTVVPEKHAGDTGEINYLSSSPDEAALVKAASHLGFVFTTRTPETVEISVFGSTEVYEILHVLEFTSNRKCMSVVVRGPDGRIMLYTKGADTVIYERLVEEQLYGDITLQHLEGFASYGLRTLCIAKAEVSDDFYNGWKQTYHRASTSISDRCRKMEEASELIEQDLILMGATAIEDHLQDGVPETISKLSSAGIKLWVLTGDKQETAINIGYSCQILTPAIEVIIMNYSSLDGTREELQKRKLLLGNALGRENDLGLVIDGQTLKYALTCDCQKDFLDVALSCKAVICCRVSPSQKAEIVHLVKRSQNAITLAIGDGANDVGMIQAAHVGVGISGLEGLQAACVSDYAIGQFRFLQKLLLVHGAWSYYRLTKLILYSFYKNICLFFTLFLFQVKCGFSGQIIFERWTLALYNVLFTALPPFSIGIFDKFCSAESMMRNPVLYQDCQRGHFFNIKVFWIWMSNSLFHSLFLFWMTSLCLEHDIAFSSGKVGDYLLLGNFVYSDRYVLGCWLFWLGLLLIPLTVLLRDLSWKVFKRTCFKSMRHKVHELEMADKDITVNGSPKRKGVRLLSESAHLLSCHLFRRSNRSAKSATFVHGYAFSQEEHGAVAQAQYIRAYNTNMVKPEGL